MAPRARSSEKKLRPALAQLSVAAGNFCGHYLLDSRSLVEASWRNSPTAIKAMPRHHLPDTIVPAACLPGLPPLTSALHTLLCVPRPPGQLTLTPPMSVETREQQCPCGMGALSPHRWKESPRIYSPEEFLCKSISFPVIQRNASA